MAVKIDLLNDSSINISYLFTAHLKKMRFIQFVVNFSSNETMIGLNWELEC